ncbi:hypothetical protein RFI_11625 [Reticulomyxa filosa]|uniref:Uncharacterized protein n=1 Tax=Reticulomyxa filosa TaxID=46433 RepID=X6NGS1_RETFI|nr:hypothetical protein RFI_11625 [Reticulomyxa filosa]|eukprot:ETO25515.1 hypothetical protein RFI_11625 [Reticulomyxa filosa]
MKWNIVKDGNSWNEDQKTQEKSNEASNKSSLGDWGSGSDMFGSGGASNMFGSDGASDMFGSGGAKNGGSAGTGADKGKDEKDGKKDDFLNFESNKADKDSANEKKAAVSGGWSFDASSSFTESSWNNSDPNDWSFDGNKKAAQLKKKKGRIKVELTK